MPGQGDEVQAEKAYFRRAGKPVTVMQDPLSSTCPS
jgi:hypothetical protein